MRDDAILLKFLRCSAVSGPEHAMSEWFYLFHKSGFSFRVLAEDMMRTTANEGVVVEFIGKLSFVRKACDAGMFSMWKQPQLTCSVDAVVLPDVTDASCEFFSGYQDVHHSDR